MIQGFQPAQKIFPDHQDDAQIQATVCEQLAQLGHHGQLRPLTIDQEELLRLIHRQDHGAVQQMLDRSHGFRQIHASQVHGQPGGVGHPVQARPQ